MADLHFEWDSANASANLRKHGISFDEAETAFSDEYALILPDPDHSSTNEERLVLIGLSVALRVLVVVRTRGRYRHPPDFGSAGNPI